ncbi:MAG: hypothetical protein O9262_15955, partial [Cyclobacteriaceae bacterium]|nr:hypothetical protein [Cyclobacteriaceae bacterium]
VQGSLQIGEDVQIFNTTPNSQFLGTSSGQITVTGSVSDAECPTYSEGVYTFCDCTGGGEMCSAVLPVELVSFTAVHQHGNVLLEWSTASELNNSHYTVERFNDLDQVIPLMDIPGKGTTTEMNHYRFMDTTPQVGDNYYRLKQVDLNGAFAYSAVVKTEVTLASQQLTLSINPSEPRFLSIKASGLKPQRRAPVSIVSADGGTCFFEYKTTTDAGNILEEIDTSTLTPGLYIVKVATLHAKFVK